MQKYTIQLSNGSITIDEDELQGVLDKLPTGNSIRIRQGVFNPSFYISITKNEKETKNSISKILNDDGKMITRYKKCKDNFKNIDFSEAGRKNRLSTPSNPLLN